MVVVVMELPVSVRRNVVVSKEELEKELFHVEDAKSL